MNPNTLTFTIPCAGGSGILNIGGSGISGFTILDSGLSISGFDPISGSYYDSRYNFIDIVGTGFRFVDKVLFGDVSADRVEIISPNLIRAKVPQYVTYDKVQVSSSVRQKTGVSEFEFVPIPYPMYYRAPLTRVFYTNPINFIGDNFSGVTGISFNNLPTVSTYLYAGDDRVTKISADVPSGNSKGYLRFYSQSGVSKLSPFIFQPEIYISGLNMISGRTGDVLRITGLYLIPELMENSNIIDWPDDYNVRIGNNFKFNMTRDNHTTLTGFIGTGAVTGPLRIMANDGGEYRWSGIFTILPDPPYISGCVPFDVYWPGETRVYGERFFNVISVEYTGGTGTPNTGLIYGYNVSADGTRISIPSTGIFDFVSGSRTGITYGLRVRTSQGDAIKTGAFRIVDYRLQGDYSFKELFTFSGYLSGYDNAQCDIDLISNLSDYNVSYRFPAVDGFNWYNSGLLYAYNVGREMFLDTGFTGSISLCITGSGNVYNREMTGIFRSTDGFIRNFGIRSVS